MTAPNTPTFTLADGHSISALGFGTYRLNGHEGVDTIHRALKNGYRTLDSAFNYENEGAVGEAFHQSGLMRDEVFISSKLPGRHHHYEEALQTIEESLYRMNLDYLDLYLIHWPNPKEDLYVEAWTALIEAQKKGLIKSIGVSNFLPEHIDRLEKETGVLPVVNQIELHPYFNQQSQREYDQSKQILTMAWSPLGRGSDVTKDTTLKQLADEAGYSIQQLILRWQHQLGVVPIPKSSSDKNQLANLEIFDFSLSDEVMDKINQLTRKDGRLNDQDPAVYQEF